MTIKLMLLKSGEDVIADVSEMLMGEGEKRTVIGYRLDKPCVIRMIKPNVTETKGNTRFFELPRVTVQNRLPLLLLKQNWY